MLRRPVRCHHRRRGGRIRGPRRRRRHHGRVVRRRGQRRRDQLVAPPDRPRPRGAPRTEQRGRSRGGLEKVDAIRGAVAGRLIDALVTDEPTATALLERVA
ncbi:hypothetical protein G7085_09720 [Tessaracoccus sp. HDW20]|nr:hypothetical protein [Tessaracoccus coleopterorum]